MIPLRRSESRRPGVDRADVIPGSKDRDASLEPFRFPSRQEVRESLVDWAGRPVPTDEIAIDYVDDKFFIVEVDVEIKPPAEPVGRAF